MVRPASRMVSAISFGVFCRSAPSTRAIMRSRKVCPGWAVMRTLIQSEITRVPPVTAERSPPLSRMTGADSPVIAASLTEATPSITSPSAGMRSPVSTRTMSPFLSWVAGTSLPLGISVRQAFGDGFGLGLAQRRRLRLAAAFGDRFGEIGEQDGEPEPEIDLEGKAQPAGSRDEITDEEDGRQARHHLDREHDRVADHDARVEFAEGAEDGGAEDLRIAQSGDGRPPPLL